MHVEQYNSARHMASKIYAFDARDMANEIYALDAHDMANEIYTHDTRVLKIYYLPIWYMRGLQFTFGCMKFA